MNETKIEDMIDYNNTNFGQIENVLTIFKAYNQANIEQDTPWSIWPEWELCLTAIDSDIWFEDDDDSDLIEAIRSHWLSVMQHLHDSENISLNGHTIEILGQHGNTFSFDVSFDSECWIGPGELEDHVQEVQDKMGKRFIQRPIPFNTPNHINHSLGELWFCPSHVPEYGGKQTYFSTSTICITPTDGHTFPSALLTLLHLCLDDSEIWAIGYLADAQILERAEWLDENWPNGVPDQDLEYQ